LSVFTADMVAGGVEAAGLRPLSESALARLAIYGNLLLKWNSRMNLTAVRDPQGILERHLVESVAAAQLLPAGVKTLMDFGSGAGLPGIPIAICRENIRVTLAESQSKKAAFLAEVARGIGIQISIHAGRVESLPARRSFEIVALRAVDKMAGAVAEARERVAAGGYLLLFVSVGTRDDLLRTASGSLVLEHSLSPTTSILLCQR
jgi:16S rRNA (guanine527-N7)-methyltransferase